jgi:carboxypeptidase Q
MKRYVLALLICTLSVSHVATAQTDYESDSVFIRKIFNAALSDGKCYDVLKDLTLKVGPRLSGSPGAAKAVQFTKNVMVEQQFDNVFLQNVKVPHWIRGAKEKGWIVSGASGKIAVPIVALGGSVATQKGGVTAQVIEVKTFQELREMDPAIVKGKIVFFNRPLDPTKLNTLDAYAGAVDQRGSGPSEAAKMGAIGCIVRSMTTRLDEVPHTGSMRYASGAPMIPAAAISTNAAELLSKTLAQNPKTQFHFQQNCETLPDAASHNVIGELRGASKSDQYIVVGGHLDSWDFGQGAHDDGSGCVQSIEAIRLLKSLGYKPNYTLRAVMYMNEENGLKGGLAYADSAKSKNEQHLAAIESDRGGFTPLGFGIVGTTSQKDKIKSWTSLFAPYGIHQLGVGGGGADIGPLGPLGTTLLGLIPDSQRYFDYHHAPNDTFDKISKRELEMGAAAMAAMVYLIDKYGLN